jgi:hypothetical protein
MLRAAHGRMQLSSDMEMEAYHHHPFPLAFQLRHLDDRRLSDSHGVSVPQSGNDALIIFF